MADRDMVRFTEYMKDVVIITKRAPPDLLIIQIIYKASAIDSTNYGKDHDTRDNHDKTDPICIKCNI